VAVEDGHPMLPRDASALAFACDIPAEDLLLESSTSAASSP
jgi:hypothetical protein